MFRRILVGYTDSEPGRDALALGGVLARATAAELVVARAPAPEGRDLTELALARGADLVVVGTTHRGPLGRIVPGATALRLLAQAPCAVAVAPAGFARPGDPESGWRPLSESGRDSGLRVIGVGYDGSPASEEALKIATDLALANGSALRVYTVAHRIARVAEAEAGSVASNAPSEAEAMQALLHDAVADLPPEVRALPVFLRGLPALELTRSLDGGVDLMVLGRRRGGPLRAALQGSVSRQLMLEAACPVLISPAGVPAPQGEPEPPAPEAEAGLPAS